MKVVKKKEMDFRCKAGMLLNCYVPHLKPVVLLGAGVAKLLDSISSRAL